MGRDGDAHWPLVVGRVLVGALGGGLLEGKEGRSPVSRACLRAAGSEGREACTTVETRSWAPARAVRAGERRRVNGEGMSRASWTGLEGREDGRASERGRLGEQQEASPRWPVSDLLYSGRDPGKAVDGQDSPAECSTASVGRYGCCDRRPVAVGGAAAGWPRRDGQSTGWPGGSASEISLARRPSSSALSPPEPLPWPASPDSAAPPSLPVSTLDSLLDRPPARPDTSSAARWTCRRPRARTTAARAQTTATRTTTRRPLASARPRPRPPSSRPTGSASDASERVSPVTERASGCRARLLDGRRCRPASQQTAGDGTGSSRATADARRWPTLLFPFPVRAGDHCRSRKVRRPVGGVHLELPVSLTDGLRLVCARVPRSSATASSSTTEVRRARAAAASCVVLTPPTPPLSPRRAVCTLCRKSGLGCSYVMKSKKVRAQAAISQGEGAAADPYLARTRAAQQPAPAVGRVLVERD